MADEPHAVDVIVVGAGPTGLSVARELQRRGVRPVVLERGRVGQTWRDVYPFVRLHTRREAASLVGAPWSRGGPTFPDRATFLAYLEVYARDAALDVRERVDVTRVSREAGGWRLDGAGDVWRADQVVWAAGVWSAPVRPSWAEVASGGFAGRSFHVADPWRLEELVDRRVLVVGAGNSGKDVAVAAAGVAHRVCLSVRDGAVFVPYPSRWTQPLGTWLRRWPAAWIDAALRAVRRPFPELGLPWPEKPMHAVVPVVGFELVEAVRAGRVEIRPDVVGATPAGVRFEGGAEEAFDVLVFATGFRPALEPVAPWTAHRAGAWLATHPDLHLVGANYPTIETYLQRLRREAPKVARSVAARAARRDTLGP